MTTKLLLTSFQTWLPHQGSNSSDDLLEKIAQFAPCATSLTLLRQLPVDVAEAALRVTATIEELQPDGIICCGMAEGRTLLTLESCATCGSTLLKTSVNLEEFVTKLAKTTISHDAGKFVCEGLYYEALQYLSQHQRNTPCIFVHVPVLTAENYLEIVADFQIIIEGMASLVQDSV